MRKLLLLLPLLVTGCGLVPQNKSGDIGQLQRDWPVQEERALYGIQAAENLMLIGPLSAEEERNTVYSWANELMLHGDVDALRNMRSAGVWGTIEARIEWDAERRFDLGALQDLREYDELVQEL